MVKTERMIFSLWSLWTMVRLMMVCKPQILFHCCTIVIVLHDEPEVEITQAQLTNWTVQLATGLAFIHENDFIHRDFKPAK